MENPGIWVGGAASLPSTDHSLSPAERMLLRVALDLGAAQVGGPLSNAEEQLVGQACTTFRAAAAVDDLRTAILAGDDPLGSWLCRIRPPARRRTSGAFYTPPALVEPMIDWILSHDPDRLIDPGCGSGRFAASAVRRQRDLPVVAIDLDPFATLLTRATLGVLGARDATVLQADYTTLDLPRIAGHTAFVGNPPYVRHHDLSREAKAWAVRAGRQFGHAVSTLAGLHVHFYLATAVHARLNDVGCFVTSAEWLDVNYGATVRQLLLNGLGGQALHLIDPRAVPFADAMTTAVISCFVVGSSAESMRLHLVREPAELLDLHAGRDVSRALLGQVQRWAGVIANRPMENAPDHLVRLRTIARVHRGVVTGANEFFVLTRERAGALGIVAWCRPAITSAEEILGSGGIVRDGPERRLLLDVPPDIDRSAHPLLDAYLCVGEQPRNGEPPIAQRYVPSHRRPWWCLGRIDAPPIVASYMARQAPVFALNPDGLALVNIAHGLYPTESLIAEQLADLVSALNLSRESFRGSGRTYHGGLEKFEPREMEALLVPMIGRRH